MTNTEFVWQKCYSKTLAKEDSDILNSKCSIGKAICVHYKKESIVIWQITNSVWLS